MPLSEDARQRLKAAAEKKKGRNNLMGLERALAAVAVDRARERLDDGTAPRWTFRADGGLDSAKHEHGRQIGFGGLRTRYDEDAKLRSRYTLKCPWVRLSFAPDWLKDALQAAFGCRFISYHTRMGWASDRAFPVTPVMEVLTFIWPPMPTGKPWPEFDITDLWDRTKKYVTGYSEAYTRKHPGVGARIRLGATHPRLSGGEYVVSKVSAEYGTLFLDPGNGDEYSVSQSDWAVWALIA